MAGNLTVKNIRVGSLSVDYLEVRWEIESTSEDVFDYTFQVLRSEAAMGPFEEASPELEDRFFFLDNTVKKGNAFRQTHYKIRVRHKPSDAVTDFGPAQHAPPADLVGIELRNRMNLLLHEFVGRRCWVLPSRTFGMRCRACWNDTLKKRMKSGCITCYDTGFVRGYHSPIESFLQIDPSPRANQQTNVGELQQQNTTARVGFFPPLKPRDLVIEPENRRWRVVQSVPTQRLRADVHQEVQLHEIPKSDMEYRIKFDFGTESVETESGTVVKAITFNDLFFSGIRNFSNPQNLDSFEKAGLPDIFTLFPKS